MLYRYKLDKLKLFIDGGFSRYLILILHRLFKRDRTQAALRDRHKSSKIAVEWLLLRWAKKTL